MRIRHMGFACGIAALAIWIFGFAGVSSVQAWQGNDMNKGGSDHDYMAPPPPPAQVPPCLPCQKAFLKLRHSGWYPAWRVDEYGRVIEDDSIAVSWEMQDSSATRYGTLSILLTGVDFVWELAGIPRDMSEKHPYRLQILDWSKNCYIPERNLAISGSARRADLTVVRLVDRQKTLWIRGRLMYDRKNDGEANVLFVFDDEMRPQMYIAAEENEILDSALK